MAMVSTHISYNEATYSAAAAAMGIENKPNAQQLAALKLVAERVFEPLRAAMGSSPINVTSGFRSLQVNRLVGGSTAPVSQHTKGEALDLQAPVNSHFTNADMFHYIKKYLDFDQLIWAFGDNNNPQWVHVSYTATANRKQVLQSQKVRGKTIYKRLND